MADVTSGLLQLCKLPVIIRKVREPVLIFLLENRFKNGGKLRQVAAGPACIAGLGRCLDAGLPVHILGDALMDCPVLIDQVVIIFIVGIKILKLPLI